MNEDPNTLLDGPLELPKQNNSSAKFHPKSSKPHKSLKIIILIVVTLLALGLGLGLFLFNKKAAHQSTKSTSLNQSSQNSATPSDIANVTTFKTYASTALAMGITYPSNWTVNENDGLHIISPDFRYETTDKGMVTGNFQIYIRQTARPIDGQYIGKGIVVKPSEGLTYTTPGNGQRKSTNITAFGSVTNDHFTYFMITSDFNLKTGDQLGSSYGQELGTYIIVGGYGQKGQKDDLSFNNTPLSTFDKKNVYMQAITIIKTIKLT